VQKPHKTLQYAVLSHLLAVVAVLVLKCALNRTL
jgi:hypothetical protein